MNGNLFVLSECRDYLRQHFFGRVPEDGADIVDFFQARERIRFLNCLYEHRHSFLQLEADCAKLLYSRRRSQPFSLKPSLQAVQFFQEKSSQVLEFLGEDENREHMHKPMEFMQYETRLLKEDLDTLNKMPLQFSFEMSKLFREIEQSLIDIREYVLILLPPKSAHAFTPAYLF